PTTNGQLPTDADLMRSIDDGLFGTAMPGWKGRLSDAERRDVLAYLKTFSSFFADTTQRPVALDFGRQPGNDPRIGRQFYDSIGCRKCHAAAARGALPSSPDDSVWNGVQRSWFPLVGQVIHKQRWFTPAIAGVWVQALHDGQAIALRIIWDDRSQSPDSAWQPFTQRVLA